MQVSHSVIITAFDNHALTKVHVRECMASTRVPEEIIVVNDGGADDLKDKLKELDIKTRLVYTKITPNITWNQNGARNLGVWLSLGNVVTNEDNDHIPFPDYYEGAIRRLEDYDVIIPRNRPILKSALVPRETWVFEKSRGTARIMATMEKEWYFKIKGYDEAFCGQYGWDVPDFKRRLERVYARFFCYGRYWMVEDGLTKTPPRVHDGKNFKMDRKNYNQLRKNSESESAQPLTPILNFNYTYEVL